MSLSSECCRWRMYVSSYVELKRCGIVKSIVNVPEHSKK